MAGKHPGGQLSGDGGGIGRRLFVSGQIIDRYTARQLFPFVSVPVLIGIALLAMFEALWTMPVALGLVGLGLGLARPTLTAIWAELFGVSALGAIRSGFAMYTVFMSGLAPFVFGLSLDLGWSVSAILWAMVAYVRWLCCPSCSPSATIFIANSVDEACPRRSPSTQVSIRP